MAVTLYRKRFSTVGSVNTTGRSLPIFRDLRTALSAEVSMSTVCWNAGADGVEDGEVAAVVEAGEVLRDDVREQTNSFP